MDVAVAFEARLSTGADFYRWGATRAIDAEVARLFLDLAALEQEHVATLARRYHVEPPGGKGPATSAARAAVYAGVEPPADDAVALLELALELERKARDFFAARVAAAPSGSRLAELHRELLAEEEEHVAMIATELELRRQGRTGALPAAHPDAPA